MALAIRVGRATSAVKLEDDLAGDDLIPLEGKVMEVHPGGTFSVETEQGHHVQAHLAGRLRRFRIRVVLGDRVTVEVSPYDLSKGRITFRHK
jgi:translation initiation factor IF-1